MANVVPLMGSIPPPMYYQGMKYPIPPNHHLWGPNIKHPRECQTSYHIPSRPMPKLGALHDEWAEYYLDNNRAPYKYIGNTPVIAAGVAFPGYPAMGAHAANSGRDTGPRTRWGVTGTPAETEPRPKENETSHLSHHSHFHRRGTGGHARTSTHKWVVMAPWTAVARRGPAAPSER